MVQRAKAVLLSADGANTDVAARVDLSHVMVSHGRRRLQRERVRGLYDAPRSGRPRTHDDEVVARLQRTVLPSAPPDATHGSVRTVATTTGISTSTVQRSVRLFGVQPHRTTGVTRSTDPCCVEQVRDVVGLDLHPPADALVRCVDEQS